MSAPTRRMAPSLWLERELRRHRFVERFPHYAAVLARLTVVDDPSVALMGVSTSGARFCLHIHRDGFADRPEVLAGVVLHEIHHIVLGHVTHAKFSGAAQPKLLELAMEMSANEGIREPLPGGIFVEDFAFVGIAPDQSTLERYQRLLDAVAEGRLELGSLTDGDGGERSCVDDHGRWRPRDEPAGDSADEAGSRQGGEGRGDGAQPSHAEDGPGDERDEAGQAATRELTRVFLDAWSEAIDARSAWRSRHAEASLVAIGTAKGEMIAQLERRALSTVDWRTALRSFAPRAQERAPSYTRPDRRFPHRIGEVPGRKRIVRRPKLLVAIDTSASMTDEMLAAVAAELDRLAAHAELTIAECDEEIQRVYAYEGRLDRVHGRGGTDLRPPFERELLRGFGAAGVVYFTDGLGPYPASAPSVPTLWVLSGDHAFDCAWGQRVRLAAPPHEAPRG